VTLWLDGESTIEPSTCNDCGAEYVLVKSSLLDEEGPYAIAFSALHDHDDLEAWIDVIFGAFEGDAVEDERVTFGCRVGPVQGSDEPAATAVQAAHPYDDGPTFGRKLSRAEALEHPRIRDFWQVVDFLLEHEPTINHHVYGHLTSRSTGRRGRRRPS
jgi:hypothetical protein